MSEMGTSVVPAEGSSGSPRLAVLLAMAMFVLVVDTSLMNVSISAVVADLNTTVSGVQSAIALEALVSAAFILISSKVGDLIGRKRAYVLGLLAYAIGALAMTLAQDLTAIIVFWAIIGGLGASLLLPAMQSLIHGNFDGAARTHAYALVGASAAIAAAVLGILVWQEGGTYVGLTIAIGAIALAVPAWWLVRRKREGKTTLLDPGLFRFPHFTVGVSGQLLQQITLGGAMIALPIFLQMTLEYNALEAGLSLAPLSLSMFGVALLAGRKTGNRRPSTIVLTGFALATLGMALIIPIVPRADSGWALFVPLLITGSGLGLLVSQLHNYTLSPIEEERVSEAAGVNSAAGSFGLSFGLAMAGGILLAFLAFDFTNLVNESKVIPPAQQQQISDTLEHDAEVMSNAQLAPLLTEEPQDVQAEILRINKEARDRSLQLALLVPLLASLLGVLNALRMRRLPDPTPSSSTEGLALG